MASIVQPWSRIEPKLASNGCTSSELDLSDIEPIDEGPWQYKPSEGDERLGDTNVEVYKRGKKVQDGILFLTRKGLACRPIGMTPNGGRAFWQWLGQWQPLVEVSENEVKFTVVLEVGDKLRLYATTPAHEFMEICRKIEKRIEEQTG